MDWNNADDRARERADRVAEVAAIDSGEWPRTLDDCLRWSKPNDPAYARRLCILQISAIDEKSAREATAGGAA